MSAVEAAKKAAAQPRALRDLLGRYGAVFRAAWKTRRQSSGPPRTLDEAEFLPAALSLQETPMHPAPRLLAWVVMALFATALVWSILGRIDITAVAAGRIIVSDRTKTIQPLERSVVQRILVKDGDAVREGQALVELDPTVPAADKATAAEQIRASTSESVRARHLIAQLPLQTQTQTQTLEGGSAKSTEKAEFPADWRPQDIEDAQTRQAAEWSDIEARLARLASDIAHRQAELQTAGRMLAKLEATLPLALKREQDFVGLAAKGYVPAHMQQDRTRERIEMERDAATQRARLVETQAALRESHAARASYIAEVRRNLHERRDQADLQRQQAIQEEAKAAQRERLTVLRSPVDGTVQQSAMHTVGGVVTEAQALMVIVPAAADVTAEVMLENKDIGFVFIGQQAHIKLDTFLYTRYGVIDAEVQKVTADAVMDEKRGPIFPVTLVLKRNQIDVDGRAVPLTPGMSLTAEMRTGSRRVIDYLLSPIQRAGNEGLRER